MAEPAAEGKKRAFGRSLSDVSDPPLSAAELDFVEKTRRGEECILGDKLPETATLQNTIRAGLIRFLALGGDDNAPVHEKGVQLRGAFVEKALDLEGAQMPQALELFDCQLKETPVLRDARGATFGLSGCAFPGLQGDRLALAGGLFLRRAAATGEVRLLGAMIGGVLACTGGKFCNPEGNALSCDGAGITGSVFHNTGFEAQSAVRLVGTQIGGNLACIGGKFCNPEGDALSFDGARITGSVFLNAGFDAKGEVRLLGTQIGGNLACIGGKFSNPKGNALSCDGAGITGSVFLQNTEIAGGLCLAYATLGTLADDLASWPDGKVDMDGFRYDRIAATSPTDARSRIDWLKKQEPRFRRGPNFAIQPWTHLAKVLRQAGHEREAVRVLIEREKRLRRSGRLGNGWRAKIHMFYGWLANYGYSPLKPLPIAAGFWLFFALLYSMAADHALFGPSNPLVFQNPAYAHCRPGGMPSDPPKPGDGNWVTCQDLPGEYSSFSPLVYSLDLILPVISLGQAQSWGPITPSMPVMVKYGDRRDWLRPAFDEFVGVFQYDRWSWALGLRFATWVEQLLGWTLGIVLAGALTGLFQRKGE